MENSAHTEERRTSEDSDLVSQAGSDFSTAETHHQNTPQLWGKTTPSLRPYLATCMPSHSQSQSFSIESPANTPPPLAPPTSQVMPEYRALSDWHGGGGSPPLGQEGVGDAASQQYESAHTRPLDASPILEPRGKHQSKANENPQTCHGCLSEGASPPPLQQQDSEAVKHAGTHSHGKCMEGNGPRKKKEAAMPDVEKSIATNSADTASSTCRTELFMLEPVFTLMPLEDCPAHTAPALLLQQRESRFVRRFV
jgi:hypothetical protein